jgi:hypothetical protein
VLDIQVEVRFAYNLAFVSGPASAAGPIGPPIVFDRFVVRVELLKRSKKIGLAGLVLTDNAGESVEEVDQPGILNVTIFEDAKRGELHRRVLSKEKSAYLLGRIGPPIRIGYKSYRVCSAI